MSFTPKLSKTADPKEAQEEEIRIHKLVMSPATRRIRATIEVLDEKGDVLAEEKFGFPQEGKPHVFNHGVFILLGKKDGAITGFHLSNLASADELRTMLKVAENRLLDVDAMTISMSMAQNEARRKQQQSPQVIVPR